MEIIEPHDEVKDRQEAELEFVSVAYSKEEAWVSTTTRRLRNNDNDSDQKMVKLNVVHRRLDLPLLYNGEGNFSHNKNGKIISLELILTMSLGYPIKTSSCISSSDHNNSNALEIQAIILNDDKSCYNDINARKIIFDALPNLVQVCEEIASDEFIEEAVLAVFTRADNWVETEWIELLQERSRSYSSSSSSNNANSTGGSKSCMSQVISLKATNAELKDRTLVLGRKLIFSHHIIAKSKRKALKDLSREYRLGGYAKIGWPGIIIIEGDENNCNRFVDEIRTMRWQHLVVRGEEQVSVTSANNKSGNVTMMTEDLDALRKFPLQFEELDEDQMSHLAKLCEDVGLKDLFMTSMKIYTDNDNGNDNSPIGSCEGESVYGVLLHIDHMNDEKGYYKWIQKSCKSVDCNFVLKKCYLNNDSSRKPIIIVCLWGDVDAVKQVLKRWRTSRVDLDSRGNPCLERMMNVLIEGLLEVCADDLCDISLHEKHPIEVSPDELKLMLGTIGGVSWMTSFSEQLLVHK